MRGSREAAPKGLTFCKTPGELCLLVLPSVLPDRIDKAPRRADLRLEMANFMTKRAKWRTEMADLSPERADLRPEKLGEAQRPQRT